MIFANIQVPTTTSIYPSSDGWIAKLLGKAAEERDGLGKGYILSKMKHASFFFIIIIQYLLTHLCAHLD